jgi:hypothetical protein
MQIAYMSWHRFKAETDSPVGATKRRMLPSGKKLKTDARGGGGGEPFSVCSRLAFNFF